MGCRAGTAQEDEADREKVWACIFRGLCALYAMYILGEKGGSRVDGEDRT